MTETKTTLSVRRGTIHISVTDKEIKLKMQTYTRIWEKTMTLKNYEVIYKTVGGFTEFKENVKAMDAEQAGEIASELAWVDFPEADGIEVIRVKEIA